MGGVGDIFRCVGFHNNQFIDCLTAVTDGYSGFVLAIFTKYSGLQKIIFCYRLKIPPLPYKFYIADLLLSHFYGKM